MRESFNAKYKSRNLDKVIKKLWLRIGNTKAINLNTNL